MEKTPTYIPSYSQNNAYSKNQHILEKPPIVNDIATHRHAPIPQPPHNDTLVDEWITNIATIARTANKEAPKITTTYNRKCIKKAISKYMQLYDKSPKKIH